MTNKFFKAVHRETGEEIGFGLEDIEPDDYNIFLPVNREKRIYCDWHELLHEGMWDIFYLHQGKYYAYQQEERK